MKKLTILDIVITLGVIAALTTSTLDIKLLKQTNFKHPFIIPWFGFIGQSLHYPIFLLKSVKKIPKISFFKVYDPEKTLKNHSKNPKKIPPQLDDPHINSPNQHQNPRSNISLLPPSFHCNNSLRSKSNVFHFLRKNFTQKKNSKKRLHNNHPHDPRSRIRWNIRVY